MIINVNKDKITINENYYINQGEININELDFVFSPEYNGLVKKAIFKNSEKAVEKTIFDNKCTIPPEVLTEDRIELRIYAYDSNMNLRYSPTYITINVEKGSYMEGTIPPKVITPSQFEQYEAKLIEGLKQSELVNIKSIQLSDGVQITTTDRNGKTSVTKVLNGPEGPQGPQGEPGETQDLTDYVKNTDYATSNKGGVIRSQPGNNFIVNSSGAVSAGVSTYEQYINKGDGTFIGKGTLENVIAGKGLVSNTDYASSSTGGVIKTGNGFSSTNGYLITTTYSYSDYLTKANNIFIGKGTLENILSARYKPQVVLTQAEYDQITPDANTLYFVTD